MGSAHISFYLISHFNIRPDTGFKKRDIPTILRIVRQVIFFEKKPDPQPWFSPPDTDRVSEHISFYLISHFNIRPDTDFE